MKERFWLYGSLFFYTSGGAGVNMDENYIEMKCTNCGADMSVSPDREVFYCEFCGQKHLLKDAIHRNYTYRKVDEARIREADAAASVRLKELELEQIRAQNEILQKRYQSHVKIAGLVLYFGLLCALVFLPDLVKAFDPIIRLFIVLYLPFGFFVVFFCLKK